MSADEKVCGLASCAQPLTPHDGEIASRFAVRRFCNRACSIAGIRRPGKPKQTHCGKGLHELVGDNLHEYTQPGGRVMRRCRPCNQVGDAARGRASRSGTARVRKPKPAPAVVAPVPSVQTRPPWRPTSPGWPAAGPVIPGYSGEVAS